MWLTSSFPNVFFLKNFSTEAVVKLLRFVQPKCCYLVKERPKQHHEFLVLQWKQSLGVSRWSLWLGRWWRTGRWVISRKLSEEQEERIIKTTKHQLYALHRSRRLRVNLETEEQKEKEEGQTYKEQKRKMIITNLVILSCSLHTLNTSRMSYPHKNTLSHTM